MRVSAAGARGAEGIARGELRRIARARTSPSCQRVWRWPLRDHVGNSGKKSCGKRWWRQSCAGSAAAASAGVASSSRVTKPAARAPSPKCHSRTRGSARRRTRKQQLSAVKLLSSLVSVLHSTPELQYSGQAAASAAASGATPSRVFVRQSEPPVSCMCSATKSASCSAASAAISATHIARAAPLVSSKMPHTLCVISSTRSGGGPEAAVEEAASEDMATVEVAVDERLQPMHVCGCTRWKLRGCAARGESNRWVRA